MLDIRLGSADLGHGRIDIEQFPDTSLVLAVGCADAPEVEPEYRDVLVDEPRGDALHEGGAHGAAMQGMGVAEEDRRPWCRRLVPEGLKGESVRGGQRGEHPGRLSVTRRLLEVRRPEPTGGGPV